jgi:hypothetical protein
MEWKKRGNVGGREGKGREGGRGKKECMYFKYCI